MNDTILYSLRGETPAKKNSRIFVRKIGRLLPSKQFAAWHDDAMRQLAAQGIRRLADGERCTVCLTFTHGDLRRRDSDNGASSVLDLLVDAGILPDDNWRVVRTLCVYNTYEKNAARCDIAIRAFSADGDKP